MPAFRSPLPCTIPGPDAVIDFTTGVPAAANVTEVVSCTPPSLAVMVSVWARVEASVVVNTPSALVTPEMLPKLLSAPEADSVTAVFASRLPLASSTVTVSVVVAVPFAATEPGLATRVEVAADGPPATKLTEVVSCTPPSLAVMVSVWARVEARVVVNTPSALVTPEMLPKRCRRRKPTASPPCWPADCPWHPPPSPSASWSPSRLPPPNRGWPPGSRS